MNCVQSRRVCSLESVLLLQRLKDEVMKFNQTIETITESSVESSLRKIMDYASRPLSDFNKYEALEMMESLQHTAQDTKHERQNFYRLVYQTVRGKLDVLNDQFRSLVLRLLGDKGHEKIFDSVAKVEKHCRLRSRDGATAMSLITGWGNRGRNSRDFPIKRSRASLKLFLLW